MKTDSLDQLKDRHFLSGKVEKFEQKMAVILIDDGQKLLWPIKDLPDDCEVGTKVRLILATSKSDQEEREQVSKTILNEILKNTDKDKNHGNQMD